jgi:hypothetical protein
MNKKPIWSLLYFRENSFIEKKTNNFIVYKHIYTIFYKVIFNIHYYHYKN